MAQQGASWPVARLSQVGRVKPCETRQNDPNHAVERVAEKRAPLFNAIDKTFNMGL